MFAMAAGASIALLLLDLAYNANNVIAVFNPLEKMLTFADASTSNAANGSLVRFAVIFLLLLQGLGEVLARYSFVLHTSPRPTVFLIWLIAPGTPMLGGAASGRLRCRRPCSCSRRLPSIRWTYGAD